MKKRYIFPLLIVGILWIGIFLSFHPIEGKIALIFHGEDLRHVVNAEHIHTVLSHYDYEIFIISDSEQIHTFHAKRIMVIYIGHGSEGFPKMFLKDEVIIMSSLIKFLRFRELILFTTSCFGGSWLSLARSNRLIISSTNDTSTYGVVPAYSPYNLSGNLVNLFTLIHTQNLPLEVAFDIWKEEIMIPWYNEVIIQTFKKISPPVMFDGIEGMVWL